MLGYGGFGAAMRYARCRVVIEVVQIGIPPSNSSVGGDSSSDAAIRGRAGGTRGATVTALFLESHRKRERRNGVG